MLKAGMVLRDIARDIGISTTRVHKLKTKAKAMGKL